MTLKQAIFFGACVFAPEMVLLGVAAAAAAKVAGAAYVNEVAESDALCKQEFESDPNDTSAVEGATIAANTAIALAPLTGGLSILPLEAERRRMRSLRNRARKGSVRHIPATF
jgi:hypothetical protein